jgi:hypothetical protein
MVRVVVRVRLMVSVRVRESNRKSIQHAIDDGDDVFLNKLQHRG